MSATDAMGEILDHICDALRDMPTDEQIMVLCTVAEHCKAQAGVVLAHEYHRAIYGRGRAE